MQRNLLGIVVILMVLVLSMQTSFCIPFTTTTESTIESNPINESSGNWNLDWSYVYKFRLSTAVAVDSYWVLTAAHVADDTYESGNIIIGGTTYTPVETRYYDGTATGTTNASAATRDLALVRFDHAFPGYYNYATGSGSDLVGQNVLSVGYGRAGTVTQFSTSRGYWSEIQNDNAKRWGTNNIDSLGYSQYSGYGYDVYTTTISTTATSGPYKDANTPYESGMNINDSGGPMFVYENNEWVVAGINVSRAGGLLGENIVYLESYSIPVGDYSEWISNVVPEPATIALLAVGGAVALLRRRRK